MIDTIVDYWVPIVATGVSIIGLGYGVRRLEIIIRHRRSEERKAMYDRLGALEVAASDQRSETKRVDEKVNNLRDGCKTLEAKVDGSMATTERTAGSVETIMKLVKVK